MTVENIDSNGSSRLTVEQTVGLEANNQGCSYYVNNGINQDYDKAASYFKLATAYGNSAGQYNLGFLYQAGKGVIKDSVQAFRWHKLSADQGNSDAQFSVANMYRYGSGIEQDINECVGAD